MSEQSARQQRDVIAVALPGQPGQFVLIQQVPAEKDATDDDDTSHASSAAPDDGCGETPPANEDELYEDEECFHNESDVSCQSKLATPADEMVEFEEEIMRQKLSLRSYHFEGNNWCEDWQMYMKNNHLVSISICVATLRVHESVYEILKLTIFFRNRYLAYAAIIACTRCDWVTGSYFYWAP